MVVTASLACLQIISRQDAPAPACSVIFPQRISSRHAINPTATFPSFAVVANQFIKSPGCHSVRSCPKTAASQSGKTIAHGTRARLRNIRSEAFLASTSSRQQQPDVAVNRYATPPAGRQPESRDAKRGDAGSGRSAIAARRTAPRKLEHVVRPLRMAARCRKLISVGQHVDDHGNIPNTPK